MWKQFIDDWNETRAEEVDQEDTFESMQRSTKRGDRLHKTKAKKLRDYKNCKHWRKGGCQSGDWKTIRILACLSGFPTTTGSTHRTRACIKEFSNASLTG